MIRDNYTYNENKLSFNLKIFNQISKLENFYISIKDFAHVSCQYALYKCC